MLSSKSLGISQCTHNNIYPWGSPSFVLWPHDWTRMMKAVLAYTVFASVSKIKVWGSSQMFLLDEDKERVEEQDRKEEQDEKWGMEGERDRENIHLFLV